MRAVPGVARLAAMGETNDERRAYCSARLNLAENHSHMPTRRTASHHPWLIVAASLAGVACTHSSASTSAAPALAAKAALPSGVTPDMIAAGNTIFNTKSCKNCHMPNGVGGVRGPDLTDDKWIHIDGSYGAIVQLVTTGFTKAEQVDPKYQYSMNPRGGVNLTDDDIRAVAAYVWSLSHPGAK
jgi:mono/diheme cytochrome c family protein